MKNPIGVFDSGLGGLTVLRALRQRFPDQDFMYLGDTARVPYGTKSPETVSQYAQNAAQFLIDKGCDAVVIACNTASAYAAETLRNTLDVPIIDVIHPLATHIGHVGYGHVLILGTRGTVQSRAYPRAIERIAPKTKTTQQACGLFVSLVEEGWTQGPIVESIVARYLEDAFQEGIPDLIVLGCTHYPMLREVIQKAAISLGAPKNIEIIDSSGPATAALAQACHLIDPASPMSMSYQDSLVRSHSPAADPVSTAKGNCAFLATDAPEHFAALAERFLGERIDKAIHVDIPISPPSHREHVS